MTTFLKFFLKSTSGFTGSGAAAAAADGAPGLVEDLDLKDSNSSLTSMAAGVLVLLFATGVVVGSVVVKPGC